MNPIGPSLPIYQDEMYQSGADSNVSLTNPAAKAQQDASSVPQPRLVKAAHEFEAAIMQELMTPLLPGHDSLDGDDAGSSSALSAFAGEALGQALSERGGFGIADRIIRQLSAGGNHSGKTPVLQSRGALPPKLHAKAPRE
jgi:Rod binding domain-containing protein